MTAQTSSAAEAKQRTYLRFPLIQRIEHLMMLLSFSTLGLTGLPQKYAASPISQQILLALGGIENIRAIHHVAAIVMMLGTIYHIIFVGYKIFVQRTRMSMLPGLQDAWDALNAFLYNIGVRKTRPQMGRFTFEEKAEYWAFVWGAVVMGLTGFLMWNPITASKLLPGEFIPAAKAAHGGEALLAVLAIIVWHMYGVHLKHFNKAMWTGRMTEQEMLHEHPLELADIKAGTAQRQLDAAAVRKRQMAYIPAAAVLTAVLLAGVFGFVKAEDTAVKTVVPQPEMVQVFVPQTPTSLPTPLPTATALPAGVTPTAIVPAADAAGLTWDNGVAEILAAKCVMCHGAVASAGLNLSTYADAMNGSSNGPVIVPGDGANSKLIVVQSAGGHPGQLLPEEIAKLIAWINAGAPEK
jgi:cytochrome b subunit of formate dehydrogenase